MVERVNDLKIENKAILFGRFETFEGFVAKLNDLKKL
jgi:hypothetical protein